MDCYCDKTTARVRKAEYPLAHERSALAANSLLPDAPGAGLSSTAVRGREHGRGCVHGERV